MFHLIEKVVLKRTDKRWGDLMYKRLQYEYGNCVLQPLDPE